ncbi:thioredoxin family protein [Pigmentiphaga soli]|uniref:Thioredoxin family protein n=1 Tax=Pigmentiphaga soli TaxID=1007095 RepID=A0ABP8GQ08_9BURK
MPVYFPDSDAARLRERLADPNALLVACLCAAWCGTCREYQPRFAELAERRPGSVFAWVDIEEHPDLAGDDDIEDFPTLLVQDAAGRTLFYGPMLPHIGHLERLLEAFAAGPAAPAAHPGPPLRRQLA